MTSNDSTGKTPENTGKQPGEPKRNSEGKAPAPVKKKSFWKRAVDTIQEKGGAKPLK